MSVTAYPALRRLHAWHEGRAALRMVVAALVAFALTNVIKLPGAYSAVLTTIIVARADTGGTLQASLDRLLATLLGAGSACLAAFGREAGVPEMLLLALTLAPLSLVVAHNNAYRTSMIAAIIVLSAAERGGSPTHVALIRTFEVGLGAVVGAVVSIAVAPSRLEQVVRRALVDLLPNMAALARAGAAPETLSARRRDALELKVRQALRTLGARLRGRRKRALTADGPNMPGLMVRSATRLNADLGFLQRELMERGALSAEQETAASALLAAFADWSEGTAEAIRREASPSPLDALEVAAAACRAAFAGGASEAGVAFLTDCLIADARALSLGVQRSRN